MKANKSSLLIMAMALVIGLGLSFSQAYAISTLDFGIISPTPGTISYAGGAAPLVGAGIEVDNVVGLSTPLNPSVTLSITGGILAFTTGNYVSTTPNTWNFGSGGTITVAGGIAPLGIADGSNLLNGTFNSATVSVTGDIFRIAGSSFIDTKNDILADYFGLLDPSITGWTGNFNLSFYASGGIPGDDGSKVPFESTLVLSGDITNNPVPEPATMLLLGSGLIGLAGYARRKFKK